MMRATTEGQVTIPLGIRERLHIEPATEVAFIVAEDGRVYIEKRNDQPASERFAKLRGIATVKMTIEEIMALTRSDT